MSQAKTEMITDTEAHEEIFSGDYRIIDENTFETGHAVFVMDVISGNFTKIHKPI